ncbi:MAG: MarR family transcriptional regulator [Acidimicrobiales bacterium]
MSIKRCEFGSEATLAETQTGSDGSRLGEAMRSYQTAVEIFDDAVAVKLGLNRTDLRCLDILDRFQPMTAGSLAHASRLSSGATTFAIDRLESAGFVRRWRSTGDRRQVLVEMVPSARQRVLDCHVPLIADARAVLAEFDADEIATICRFLKASTEIFERNIPD